ncbi:glutathione S-transferase-like [Phymastichus coffea]|uniref:glutathione S-transferase-like n=1 Tax=Phymastichus coffea TaxID=108790 RepID=UPI00273CE8C9|nr:glutathione S-transferase-like [Phymastichus coffea]
MGSVRAVAGVARQGEGGWKTSQQSLGITTGAQSKRPARSGVARVVSLAFSRSSDRSYPKEHLLNRRAKATATMPSYKLTYFNITGLGEPLRFLLHYAGIDFEDFRVEFEDWPALKSKMPMEQIPILEIDGRVYHQTRAISRYLAKKGNLYGSNELEALEIDMCVDDIEDCRLYYSAHFREQEPARKAKLLELAIEKTPWYLAKFEQRVKKNGGYFVAGKLSWADTHFSAIIELISNIAQKEFVKDFPALDKLDQTVRSTPKIKAYLDKRPHTKF